jgi:hypothetical protein
VAEPLTGPGPVRCSVLSAERDEPMLGTAFTEPGVLLVEQPGPWGHAGLSASRFDPAVAEALAVRARSAGLRVLAIRRPAGGFDGPRRRWAVWHAPDPAGSGGGGLVWSDFGADVELLDVPLDGSVGEVDPEPLYLVCAHGKRDVCCALRGRPLVAALAARRPGRVWECSHTGGHRFAPIVLALPTGALYGRVPESDADGAAAVIAATERGEVIPDLLRGLLGFAPVEQAAIGHLMIARSLTDPRAVTVRSSVHTEPGQWDVRLDVAGAGDSRWLVRLAVESVEISYASCAKPAAKAEREIGLVDLSPCHEQ